MARTYRVGIRPDISWEAFDYYNDKNPNKFEDMCRQIFINHFADGNAKPHSNPNQPGIEINPVLERAEAKKPQRMISFQAKYFSGRPKYEDIKDSAEKTVKYYSGRLDAVYLFCNKQLDNTAPNYVKITEILATVGIELVLVTGPELLDLVRKDPVVAKNYFTPRYLLPKEVGSVYPDAYIEMDESNTESAIGCNEFVTGLISEKIDKIGNEIIDLNLRAVRPDLDRILDGDVDEIKEKYTLSFYAFLLAIRFGEKEKAENYSMTAGCEYAKSMSFLTNFWKNPRDITFSEFVVLAPEAQALLIDKMFLTKHWDNLINLRETAVKIEGTLDKRVMNQLDFHCALSYINKRNISQAGSLLENAGHYCDAPKRKIFLTCVKIMKVTEDIQNENKKQMDSLPTLLHELAQLKLQVPELAAQNEIFVASVEIQAYCTLAQHNTEYIQDVYRCYETYSDETKAANSVKYYIAVCHEFEKDFDEALSIYSTFNWTEEEAPALRRMSCHIQKGNPEEVLNDFEKISIESRTPRTEGIYLYALSLTDRDRYRTELQKTIQEYRERRANPYYLALYADDKEIFDEVILPYFSAWLSDKKNLQSLPVPAQICCTIILSRFDQIKLLHLVLGEIEDVSILETYAAHSICSSLFRFLNQNFDDIFYEKEVKETLDCVESIALRFEKADILRKKFLQILVMHADAAKAHFRMLKYARMLFDCEKAASSARIIVQLLNKLKEKNPHQYTPYLAVLEDSDIPEDSMAMAWAYQLLERAEDAEKYAYKALYLLNEETDYMIYRNYLGLHLNTLGNGRQDVKMKTASRNTVVTLRENQPCHSSGRDQVEKTENLWIVCLDSEREFSNEANRSLNIQHAPCGSPLYYRLYRTGVRQSININGKSYTVLSVEPREIYATRFVFQKFQEKPNEFKESGYFLTITNDNPQEAAEQIKRLIERTSTTKKLLSRYHFEDNSIGLPIDSLSGSNFDRYINFVKYLLYAEGQALYTGEQSKKNLDSDVFVPSLSTLIILAVLNHFDILQIVQNKILIPESYITFFEDCHKKCVDNLSVSKGSFDVDKDGRLRLLDPDYQLPEIWIRIGEECQKYKRMEVTDDERIAAELSGGIRMEEFFSHCNFHTIHMDAMILAKKEDASFICDDLFFRKIAVIEGIKNINVASLLYLYENLDFSVPILLELSQTNYIYLPLLCRSNEEMISLLNNLLTGERKNRFYGKQLESIIVSILRSMAACEEIEKK